MPTVEESKAALTALEGVKTAISEDISALRKTSHEGGEGWKEAQRWELILKLFEVISDLLEREVKSGT
jgi:hypothetical protein